MRACICAMAPASRAAGVIAPPCASAMARRWQRSEPCRACVAARARSKLAARSVTDTLPMMPVPSLRHFVLAALAGTLILAGCSQGGAPAPDAAQQQAQAKAAEAARNLDTYRQLLRIHNDQMAAAQGEEIVQRFPGSAAAKEVQQTLPEVEK